MQVRSLGWEDPLEEGMATHSRILAWRITQTEEPGRLQSTGLQRVGHDWSNLAHTHAIHCRDTAQDGRVDSGRTLLMVAAATNWILSQEITQCKRIPHRSKHARCQNSPPWKWKPDTIQSICDPDQDKKSHFPSKPEIPSQFDSAYEKEPLTCCLQIFKRKCTPFFQKSISWGIGKKSSGFGFRQISVSPDSLTNLLCYFGKHALSPQFSHL